MLRFSVLFAAGVAGVLVGLLSKPLKRRPVARCFSIKRTKSEVGYTFWILEGFGRHKCFVLCDTWQEAIDEANRRLRRPATPSYQAKTPSDAAMGSSSRMESLLALK
jgi:hypothetical protein